MSSAQPGSVIPDEVGAVQPARGASGGTRPGRCGALHAMNPLRVGWIDERIRARFGAPQRVLDFGCGAGLAAEALARLGHEVLGVDAAPDAIAAARAHAEGQELALAYREGAAENARRRGPRASRW